MDFATVTSPYVAKPLRLRPFRAVMLAPSRVGDPASARALARPYRDVAARLAEWIEQGRAIEDSSAGLYLHEYTARGLTVRGLVGALDLSRRAVTFADRALWPHEAIHPEQAGELAERMREMQLNPAPILLVHHGEPRLRQFITDLAESTPDWSYLDRVGQRQRIWAVREPSDLEFIQAQLTDAHCLLADGHHRYAAYLRLQEAHPDTAWEAGLAMIVDQLDTPLFLGAIHRTIAGATTAEISRVARTLGAQVDEQDRTSVLSTLDQQHIVLTDGLRWLALRPDLSRHQAVVAWLHESLLPALRVLPSDISHHHSVEEALEAATADCPAFLLPSPKFSQVQTMVESGGLFPEKATSFQPKPSLGALMRPVHDG